MLINVVAEQTALTAAIDEFNPKYHAGYFAVRRVGKDYLAGKTKQNVAALVLELSKVLEEYGAGRRGAPTLRPNTDMCAAFMNEHLYNTLRTISTYTVQMVRVANALDLDASQWERNWHELMSEVGKQIHEAIRLLSEMLFVGATNVTYPMKALLLVTGLMPAYDSQVRYGLHKAGMSGFGSKNGARTRYLIPKEDSQDGLRISTMPYLLAKCYRRNQELFSCAVAGSRYGAELSNDIGRVFDILLFMQGTGRYDLLRIETSPSAVTN